MWPSADRRRATAEPQAQQAAEQNGANLGDGRRAEQNDQRARRSDGRALAVRTQRARHAPDGLRDDGDRDQFEPVEQTRSGGAAESAGAVGEKHQHDRRRQGEAGPCRKRAGIAGAHQSDRKSSLARGRSRQELAERNQIDIGLFVEPAPADDELFAEIADMRNRPAKGADAELEEDPQNFEWSARMRLAGDAFVQSHVGRPACRPRFPLRRQLLR